MALGVLSDYVDYMMGHTVSVYHDIESKGIDFFRNIYAGAALSIKPRSAINKTEMVKEFARGLGLDPEAILIKHNFTELDTKYYDPKQKEHNEIRFLMEAIRSELIESHTTRRNYRNHRIRIGGGAAGRDRTCDQRVAAVCTLNSFSPLSGSAALTTELSSTRIAHTAASVLGGFFAFGSNVTN